MSELLTLSDVTLQFRGLTAVSDVSFDLPEGQVAALIGPNGAGKTSIFNVICGFYKPQQGTVYWRGKPITGMAPHMVARTGIGRSFQNIELFKGLTCLDNLLLGRHMHVRATLLGALLATPGWARDEVRQRRKAEELMDLLDLQAYRDQRVGSLPYGVQKLIEVARLILTAEDRDGTLSFVQTSGEPGATRMAISGGARWTTGWSRICQPSQTAPMVRA